MPRPSSPVIHPDLIAHLRPVSSAALVDECVIRRPGTPGYTYDPITKTETASATSTIYTGACRVDAPPTNERVVDIGQEPVTLRTYDVWIPATVTTVQVNDVVDLTATDNAWLLTRLLRIVDVSGDSLDIERHLVCEDSLG